MDVIYALQLYFKQMIEECGKGMKALLLDEETISIISSVYSQSQMLQMEVYLFERIDLLHSKCRLNFIKCIVFVRPTDRNVQMLQQELRDPKFASYHMYFSNHVTKEQVQSLAESDEYETVRCLKESFADYLALNPHFFSINLKTSCYGNNKNRWNQTNLIRTSQALIALLLSFGQSPTIRYQTSSLMCKELAEQVKLRLMSESTSALLKSTLCPNSTPLLLLILDRKSDSITPMLNQWTYQAMIHELLTINNHCIDLSQVADIPADMKKIVLSAETDQFYQNNMFLNYGEINNNIKLMLEKFQSQVESQKKMESIKDMSAFFEQYPEFKRLSGTVNRHVVILGELSRIIAAHKLFELSEVEQELACNGNFSEALKRIKALVSDSCVRPLDALRLVMLYVVCNEKCSSKEKKQLIQLLKTKELDEDQLKSIEMIGSFVDRTNSDTMKMFTKKVMKEFQAVENIYTQHNCWLKDILNELIRGKLKTTQFPYAGTIQIIDKPQQVVVFIIGGATYEESLAVYNLNKLYANQIQIVLGSTQVHNFASFLQELTNASNTNS